MPGLEVASLEAGAAPVPAPGWWARAGVGVLALQGDFAAHAAVLRAPARRR